MTEIPPHQPSGPPRTRRLGEDCLSDLVLDRLALGELDPGGESRARSHLSSCVGCRAAAAALEENRSQFLAGANLGALAADALARAAAVPDRADRKSTRLN